MERFKVENTKFFEPLESQGSISRNSNKCYELINKRNMTNLLDIGLCGQGGSC